MKLYFKRGVMSGFIITILTMGLLGVYAYASIMQLIEGSKAQSRSLLINTYAEKVLVTIIDIETGQRGFVITGDPLYLQPYDNAVKSIDDNLSLLEKVMEPFPDRKLKVDELKRLVTLKMESVKGTIDARNQGFEVAQARVLSGDGKRLMDNIRGVIGAIQSTESNIYNMKTASSEGRLDTIQYVFTGVLAVTAVALVALLYSINVNLNERELAAVKLHRAHEDVMKLNHELESFTYSVSHDLRAPLRSVNGYANVLMEDYGDVLDDQARQTITVIARNGKRMGQLIDDLLDFSHLGRKEVQRAPLSMNEIVHKVIDDISETTHYPEKASIDIRELSDVNADVGMMRQVWYNLISNALKYSGKSDNPTVEIGSFLRDNYVCYYVKDNGVGFNMAYVNKLFGIFQRLHKQEEFEGTGVGLALIKRIVDRHEGNVWAEGELNKGATFFFSIPIT